MMTAKLSCIEALVVLAVDTQMDWPTFNLLARWLEPDGCYIEPASRQLSTELTSNILIKYLQVTPAIGIRHQVFQAWLALDKIEVVLNIESQERIIPWIQQSILPSL